MIKWFFLFLQSLSIEESFNAGKKCSYDQLILSEPFKQDVVLCGQINSSHSQAEESSMVTKRNLPVLARLTMDGVLHLVVSYTKYGFVNSQLWKSKSRSGTRLFTRRL